MEKSEIEFHHIVFSIASIIVSMIFTVWITPGNLGTNYLISFIIYFLVLLFFVKTLSVLLTAGILGFLKEILKPFKHQLPFIKKPLGPGDITLNASVIISGFIVLEFYKTIIHAYPQITADYLYILLTIIGTTIIVFPITYYMTKHIGPKEL